MCAGSVWVSERGQECDEGVVDLLRPLLLYPMTRVGQDVHPAGSDRVEQIPGTRFRAAQIEDDISENTLDNVAARFTANPVRI